MNKKLNHFTYSQNSINTYKSCPLNLNINILKKSIGNMMIYKVENTMKV